MFASLAAGLLALGSRAEAQPDTRTRRESPLLAFGVGAEAVAGPASLDRLFDAMRAAPPLQTVPWRQPPPARNRTQPYEGTVPLFEFRSNSPGLIVPLPVETPEYRHTFRALMRQPEITDRFDKTILRYGERYGLNPRLLKAIIAAESEFVERAASPKGALGLMQLAPATAGDMGVAPETLEEPEANIRAGAAYLRHLFERAWRRYRIDPRLPFSRAPLGIVERVIAAYNAGPRFLAHEHLFAETRQYVRKVLLFLRSPVATLRRHR